MKTFYQSPSLAEAFKKQVDIKKSAKREEVSQVLGNGLLGSLGSAIFEIKQVKNQVKGSLGEWGVSLLVQSLPDSWVMFNNALIPTSYGNLTEIDLLIIGPGGIFLIEVKNWKGSFSAYKDKWKRRDGNSWVEISNSPSSQSAYHQKMFGQWITSQVPHLPDSCITAPVVFITAKWIGATNCSVPVLQGIPALLSMIVNSPECLTPTQVQTIAQAVQNLEVIKIPSPVKRKKIIT
jgi:hypothetical protein